MSDGKSRENLRRLIPDELETDRALEAALREEEVRAKSTPLVGPELVTLRPGGVARGKVLAILDDRIVVDLSYKAEGVIAKEEFGENLPAVGSEIEAAIVRLEDANGQVALSVHEAQRRRVFESVAAGDKAATVHGRVVEAVKGGLVIDIGVRAFLPAREVDLRFVEDLSPFVGKDLEVRVIEADPVQRKVVVSRRAILSEERQKKRDALFETIAPGQVLKGVVTNLTDFGAFVDIGGAEGLIHKGDLAWGRVNHPSEVLKVGEAAQVSVLGFDKSSGKIGLGLKQAGPSPWDAAPIRYAVGNRAKGRVVGLLDFGAVIELEPGIQGLCHVSEMSWNRRVRMPSEVVKLNQEVEVEVILLDLDRRKLSLSIKRVEENPWASLDRRYPFATIVDGTVTEFAEFGAFVTLDDGVVGLVHVSELSWTRRYKHPSEALKIGQRIKAIVMGSDQERQRLSLSIRATEPDPWWDIGTRYPVGTRAPATITRCEAFGAFARLEEGVEGLIHISRLGEGRVSRVQDVVRPNDQVDVEVVEVSEEARKIGLRLVQLREE